MAKLLITKEEMILIKYSEASKDTDLYGNLYESLQPYDRLSEFELDRLALDRKAETVIRYNRNRLIEALKAEWSALPYSDEAAGDVHCSLCGRKNKYMFYIQNQKNDKEINVGSECIKKFHGIDNIENIRRSHQEKLRLRNENRRRIDFDAIDLEDIYFLSDYEAWTRNFPIIFTYGLYMRSKNHLLAIHSLKTRYIKTGGNLEQVKTEFFDLKAKLSAVKEEAEQYLDRVREHPLVCKRFLADFLETKHPAAWMEIMKNGGIMSEETLCYAYHPDFLKEHIHTIKSCLAADAVQIFRIKELHMWFRYQDQNYTMPIHFRISSYRFMKNIGRYCLTKKGYQFTRKTLMGEYELVKTEHNFTALLNRLEQPLVFMPYSIATGRYTNEHYFKQSRVIVDPDTETKRTEAFYLKINIDIFFKVLEPAIFYDDRNLQKVLQKLFLYLKKYKWMSAEEWHEHEEMIREMTDKY